MTPLFVAEVAVVFTAGGRDSAEAIADALMDDLAVVTVRVDYDGRAAVYRADIECDDPRDALQMAMVPVSGTADGLRVEYAVIYGEVTRPDPSVPFTARAVVHRWNVAGTDDCRSIEVERTSRD
jgi:hypothetical protein